MRGLEVVNKIADAVLAYKPKKKKPKKSKNGKKPKTGTRG